MFGVLATDRTHQFKAQFLYDFNFGLSAGLNWFGASGLPRSREMGFLPPNNFPVNYLGRNSDGRLPFYSQADLYAQYRLRLGQRSAVTFSVNVINLLDQKTAHELLRDRAATTLASTATRTPSTAASSTSSS